tara:strand:+ start:127 stop:624 length:498 start_codon:yes stop_codon:yes gene_type:complete
MRDDAGKKVSFAHVVRELVRKKQPFVLENRPLKWLYGLKNYGDIPAWINPADGDPYDVLVPGYDRRLPFNKPMVATSIIGVLWLENCNHKLAVRTDAPGFDGNLALKQISDYAHNYQKRVKVKGEWVFYDCAVGLIEPESLALRKKRAGKSHAPPPRNARARAKP